MLRLTVVSPELWRPPSLRSSGDIELLPPVLPWPPCARLFLRAGHMTKRVNGRKINSGTFFIITESASK